MLGIGQLFPIFPVFPFIGRGGAFSLFSLTSHHIGTGGTESLGVFGLLENIGEFGFQKKNLRSISRGIFPHSIWPGFA
jgi:hypothetical protein